MYIKILEKLARSDKYQIIYNRAKEINGLQLFDNVTNQSHLQIMFLHFLSLYSMLYQDLNSGEDFISEEVIEDSIRTEAYLLLRKELKDKKKSSKTTKQSIDTANEFGSLIFRKRGK